MSPRLRPLSVSLPRLAMPTVRRPRGGWGAPATVAGTGAIVAFVVALPVFAGGAIAGSSANTIAAGRAGLIDTVSSTLTPTTIRNRFLDPSTSPDEASSQVTSPGSDAGTVAAVTNVSALAGNGIPQVALAAYQNAASSMAIADPTCRIDWSLLAGIGRVESNHGQYGGAVVTPGGVSVPAVIGIRLDGSVPGTDVIKDSDGGALDGDREFDRAVGPMQFLPGSWAIYGVDANGDGLRNPQDINDAALAAGAFLCSGPEDLSTPAGASVAVRRYNNSAEYVSLVLSLAKAYKEQLPLPLPPSVPTVIAPSEVPVAVDPPAGPASPPLYPGLEPAGVTPGPASGSSTTTTDSGSGTSSGSLSGSSSGSSSGTGTSGTATSGTGTGTGTSGTGTSGTATSGTGTSGTGTSGTATSGTGTSGTATSGTATSGTATSGTATSGTSTGSPTGPSSVPTGPGTSSTSATPPPAPSPSSGTATDPGTAPATSTPAPVAPAQNPSAPTS